MGTADHGGHDLYPTGRLNVTIQRGYMGEEAALQRARD